MWKQFVCVCFLLQSAFSFGVVCISVYIVVSKNYHLITSLILQPFQQSLQPAF